MHRNHIHCKDMTQSLLIYTERQQRLCTRAAINIRHSQSHCKGTTQLLRTYTSVRRSKSIDFSIFWSIYMRRNHIHCKDTTHSLLIYTERQQRLCTRAAINIRHSHSYCKGTTQLLRTYTSVRRSKSIGFSVFWSTYMRRKYRDQSSFSSFKWVITQRTQKLTSKWSAFTILNCLCDHLII